MSPIKEIAEIVLGRGRKGSLKVHMVRGTVGTFALKVANTVLAFGTSLLLARLLGAKEYGIYAYAISWASLLSVPAVMGLNILLIREVAKYKAVGDWGALREILRWSDRVVFVTSTVVAALFTLTVWIIQRKFAPEVRMALWLAMALVPLLSFLLLRQGELQGLGYVVEAQVPQLVILPGIFLVVTGSLCFVVNLNGVSATGLRLFAGVIATFVALLFLRKHLAKEIGDATHICRYKEWLKSALPLLFVGIASIINLRVSTIIVGSMVGAKAAGVFSVAQKIALLVSYFPSAVSMPLSPSVAALYAMGEKVRLQRLITKSARVSFLGSLTIMLGIFFLRKWILLIFGQEFVEGEIVLVILSAGWLAGTAMGPVTLLLNMSGYEWDTARGLGGAALVNVLLNVLFIPIWGILGAAIANAASIVTWSVLLAILVHKRMGLYSAILRCVVIRRS